MKTSLWLLAALIVLSGCESTDKTAQQAEEANKVPVEQMITMAGHYEKGGEYEKALVYYLKALEESPEDIQLAYRVAELHKQMGKPEYALHMLQRVIASDPNHTEALTEAAMIYLENKDVARATDYFLKVRALDQKRLRETTARKTGFVSLDNASPVDAYNGLGVAYDLNGRYKQAQEMYALCLELTPHAPVILTNVGYSFYLAGQYSDAITYFQQAIEINPGHKRSWSNLGLVYTRMGRYNKAFQTLKRVMNDAQAYNDLGYFLMLESRYEEAEYFFEKAINASPKYYKVAYENLSDVRHQRALAEGGDISMMP